MPERKPSKMIMEVVLIWLPLAVIAILLLVFAYNKFWRDTGSERNPYDLDLEKYSKISPELLTYEVAGEIKLNIDNPMGLTANPSGEIYVGGNGVIVQVDLAGKEKQKVKTGFLCKALTCDADGGLFVASETKVYSFDARGLSQTPVADLGDKAMISSIGASDKGIYAADLFSKRVMCFSRKGELLRVIGEKNKSAGILGFIVPSPHFDLAVAGDDSIWVVNPGQHALEDYSPDGKLRSSWKKPGMDVSGFCGCCNPTDIALLKNGDFVTAEKGFVRVKIYGPTGEFKEVVSGPENFSQEPSFLDLAVMPDGKVLVLDTKARKIVVFVKKDKK